MTPKNILALLQGRDRRKIGQSNRVVALVTKDPKLFPQLIASLWSSDPVVQMRAADAAEKVTRVNHPLLVPFKKELLGLMTTATEQEMRWHLAVMIPRLPLTARERQRVSSLLNKYLDDRSSIVKTFALQGLADLAKNDPNLSAAVVETLREAHRSGTPAMRARSRRLLLQLER